MLGLCDIYEQTKVIILVRIAAIADAAYYYRRSSVVCLSVCVCLLVTFMSLAQTVN